MSGHSTKKSRRGGGHEEDHGGHERWLVTYADMLTLLMVLFIVMFAMSAVDQKKFKLLADGLAEGFGAPSVTFEGQPEALDGQSANRMPSIEAGAAPKLDQSVVEVATPIDRDSEADRRAVQAADRARASALAAAAVREVKNLRRVQAKITAALRAKGLADVVRFHIDERGLVVTVVSSEVVFAGDRADLLTAGRTIMGAIAPTLAVLPNGLQVDGHTNQLPVPTVNYPSAWELSTARASTVVRYLQGHGIAETRMTAAGHAGTRPLYDPSDPRAPRLNRRVDIVVLSTLNPTEKALLPSAAGVSSPEN